MIRKSSFGKNDKTAANQFLVCGCFVMAKGELIIPPNWDMEGCFSDFP